MRNIYTAGKVVIFQNKYFKGITPLNHELLQSGGGGGGGGMRGFKSFSGSSKSTLLICLIVLYVVIQIQGL